MIVELPEPRSFGAAVVAGLTQASGTLRRQYAVILKAGYDLVAGGSGERRFVPANDPARSALVMADLGVNRYTEAGGTSHAIPASAFGVVPADDPADPDADRPGARFFLFLGNRTFLDDLAAADPPEGLAFDLTREADTALDKARSDIVVEGFVAAAAGGAVLVDGEPWALRAAAVPGGLDTSRNLFGWHGKAEAGRGGGLDPDFEPTPEQPFPEDSGAPLETAAFNNIYRRSAGFTTPGDRNTAALPSGGLVEVYQGTDTSGDPAFAARLPDLAIGVRLRVYCGHGPDEAARWRKVDLGALRPDTLILRPDQGTAEILWRTRWPADTEPQQRYRKVQLRREGF
jgi:hypothetical protein